MVGWSRGRGGVGLRERDAGERARDDRKDIPYQTLRRGFKLGPSQQTWIWSHLYLTTFETVAPIGEDLVKQMFYRIFFLF